MKTHRPAIVTIVGHIDHGKSTLLDAIRKTDEVRKESGDITQHIGAYEVQLHYEGAPRKLTMIDTPGHEVFSHIREHSVDIADLAILIVSAEEGWKEQTQEAYDILIKNEIPFIIAFTKIDSERANIEKVKQSVMGKGILLEGLGGSVSWIGTSAKTGEGIPDLADLLFLTADIHEIGAEQPPEENAIGVVVESDVDEKTGITATIILIHNAIAKGSYVRVGTAIAPVRIMQDDDGNAIDEAHPSSPIRISGFSTIPPVGETVYVYDSKKMHKKMQQKKEHKPYAEKKKMSHTASPSL